MLFKKELLLNPRGFLDFLAIFLAQWYKKWLIIRLKSQNFEKSYKINFKKQTILHNISEAFSNLWVFVIPRAVSVSSAESVHA